jgi:hypothetical protein
MPRLLRMAASLAGAATPVNERAPVVVRPSGDDSVALAAERAAAGRRRAC